MAGRLSDEDVGRLAEDVDKLDSPYARDWSAMAGVSRALRQLRRERAQLAARVEELEDQNRALKAALDGTLLADDGPEAA